MKKALGKMAMEGICYFSRSDFVSERCHEMTMSNSLFCEKHSWKNGVQLTYGFIEAEKRRRKRPHYLRAAADMKNNNRPEKFRWGECGRCGEDGHTGLECVSFDDVYWQTLSGGPHRVDRCRICGLDGHIGRDCDAN